MALTNYFKDNELLNVVILSYVQNKEPLFGHPLLGHSALKSPALKSPALRTPVLETPPLMGIYHFYHIDTISPAWFNIPKFA